MKIEHNNTPLYLTSDTSFKNEVSVYNKSQKITIDPFIKSPPNYFLQGDIITGIPFYIEQNNKLIGLESDNYKKFILLSNTCDMSLDNKRKTDVFCTVAPVLNLQKLESVLQKNNVSPKSIKDYINSIVNNLSSHHFYIPINNENNFSLNKDGHFADLSNVFHIKRDNLDLQKRIKSLGNFYHYFLTLKLSHHFCRLTDRLA